MKTTFKNLSKGLLASAFGLVLVFAGSAYKADNNGNRVQYTFRYNGPNHSEANVETESNWIYDASAPQCDGEQEQACTIKVDPAYVNAGSTPTLKSSLDISATYLPSLTSAYVDGSADEGMLIENRTAE